MTEPKLTLRDGESYTEFAMRQIRAEWTAPLEAEVARLRANIAWARGMCSDMEEHWRIDEFLGLALDGMEPPEGAHP